MQKPIMTVATCQFAVSGDPRLNGETMRGFIGEAAAKGADVVHFSECALSGYCRPNFPTWDGYDWDALRTEAIAVMDACRLHRIWAVVGSSHRLTGENFPHNSVYVITPDGEIADRYDKRRCSMGDLTCYTPGDHPVAFEVNGVRCGIVICMEERAPELWQAYADDGVNLIFHSTSGGLNATADTKFTEMSFFLARANAQQYQVFVSQASWCPPFQEFPSLWVERGGHIVRHCERHVPGMMLHSVPNDPEGDEFYAMVRRFRATARDGSVYRDYLRHDSRSTDRTSL
jgi:deaminated glutathione amidase